jgi:hypothetical protein
VFRLNDQIDQNVTKPLAQTYVDITPSIIRTGVRNFFGNISDAWSAANSALQFKPQEATEGFLRVLINSTLGVYGLMDWATPMKLERHSEDFGQTLAVWGVGSGPYLVLPLLGPSYHKHGAYILDQSDTPGFTVPELHRLGLLVLGHRGKLRKLNINFDDEGFCQQLMCLRLAVILCHARREPEYKSLRIKASKKSPKTVDLEISQEWIDAYPQSYHLLFVETQSWLKTSWDLKVIAT